MYIVPLGFNPDHLIYFTDIIPMIQSSDSAETREFLQKIMELLIDYVNIQNDRKEKILDFHHPEDMKKLLSLEVPDDAVSLQQLVKDCAITLKYQVKTGKFNSNISHTFP